MIHWHWDTGRAPDAELIITYGFCRSGQRWFWFARARPYGFSRERAQVHGWAHTKKQAQADVRGAVVGLAGAHSAVVYVDHRGAESELQQVQGYHIKTAPPPADAEYLYSRGDRKFRIVKRTGKRIYHMLFEGDAADDIDNGIGFIDRRQLEQQGRSRSAALGLTLYRERLPQYRDKLAKLKQAAIAAHPDRGGSSEAFIAAWAKYVAAREVA